MTPSQTGALQSRVAIVTGGGRGIGAAMVRALHAEGARVLIADITGDQCALAEELGDRAIGVHTDVADDTSVKDMIAQAVSIWGQLDVLCNNAGVDGEITPTADCTLENFDRVLGINLRGVFSGIRHAVPVMIDNGGGSIINTASAAGLVAFPGLAAYGVSKAGVIGLTRVAAVEYAKAGVRVNAICPGIIMTPLIESIRKRDPDAYLQLIGAAEQMTPIGRAGAPAEVAAAAVFLASDASSFLTGAAIPVDGGYTAI